MEKTLEEILDRILKVNKANAKRGMDEYINASFDCRKYENAVDRIKAWAEKNQINLLVCGMETYRRLEEIIINEKVGDVKRNLFADFFESLNQPNSVLLLTDLDQAPISLTGWLIRLVDGFNTRKLFNPDKYKGLLFTIATINPDVSGSHRLDASLCDRLFIFNI